MKRETRYVVLKLSDIEKYVSAEYKDRLTTICNSIIRGRDKDNKQELDCVVVEHDWPEYEPTWQAIEKRVDGA